MTDEKIKNWSTELFGVEVSGCESCRQLMVGTARTCLECQERRKACKEYHPLPCGVDEDCGFVELMEQWREHGGPADEACADELEEVLSYD